MAIINHLSVFSKEWTSDPLSVVYHDALGQKVATLILLKLTVCVLTLSELDKLGKLHRSLCIVMLEQKTLV